MPTKYIKTTHIRRHIDAYGDPVYTVTETENRGAAVAKSQFTDADANTAVAMARVKLLTALAQRGLLDQDEDTPPTPPRD